jgi:hypothetical protein
MVGHSSLFSQLLLLVNRHQFQRRVKERRAEKAAKGFSCWSQFVAMMFCQLAQAKSLREISDGLTCCEGKLNHLGARKGSETLDVVLRQCQAPLAVVRASVLRSAGFSTELGAKEKTALQEQAPEAGRQRH